MIVKKMRCVAERSAGRLALLSVLLVIGPMACAKQQPHDAGFVAVQGYASVQVVPDEIHFNVGVSATEPTAQEAYNVVESRMQLAMQQLNSLSIEAHDIQAVNVSLTPVIDYKQREKIIGHKASRNIQVKVTDIRVYAKAIGKLANIEQVRFSQVRQSSSAREALVLEALEKAYDNAEQKARHLLKRSGRKLGALIEISEQTSHTPTPVHRRGVMMAAESADSATVSPGTIAVTATVQARFAIQ
jgi:hypothetical protein